MSRHISKSTPWLEITTGIALCIAFMLAGCGDKGSVEAAGPSDDTASLHAFQSAPSAPASVSTELATGSDAANQGISHLDKTCQEASMRLTLDTQSGMDVPRTMRLETTGQDVAVAIQSPEEMKGYTAVGMACAVAADGKPYFVVQYGELPEGCEFCEWFYLYDAKGRQLTHSNPPLLEDASRPKGSRQFPNNKEYQDLIQKLGIRHPEVDFIEEK